MEKITFISPQERWDSSLYQPKAAIQRIQHAFNTLLQDLQRNSYYNSSRQYQSLALKQELLQNELSRLKLGHEELEGYLKQDLPKTVKAEVLPLEVMTKTLAQELDQLSMQRKLVKTELQNEFEKRLFLVEQHSISIEQAQKDNRLELEKCLDRVSKIDVHIDGGARLQSIERRIKEDQIVGHKLQSEIFDELKKYLIQLGSEVDQLKKDKLNKKELVDHQIIRTLLSDHKQSKAAQFNISQLNGLKEVVNETKHSNAQRLDSMSSDLARLTKMIVSKPSSEQLDHLDRAKLDKAELEILQEEVRLIQQDKVDKKQFRTRMNEQREVNQAMFRQNILARWLWNTEGTKGGLVPWNVQIINSRPQIFIWKKDHTEITINCSGVYHITAGFFASRKPTISVLINSRPVPVQINGCSYVVQHSSGRVKQHRHPSGEVSGLSVNDFLLLAENTILSIKYEGVSAQGFLMLQRL